MKTRNVPLRLRTWIKNLRDAMRRPLTAGAASFLFLSGCASREPRQVVQDAVPFIPVVTAAIGTATLGLAVEDPVERKQISDELYAVALGVRSLMGGVAPTRAQIEKAITSFGGSDTRYAGLAASVGGLWSGLYPQMAKGDVKLAFDVLEAIARGCEAAAKNFDLASEKVMLVPRTDNVWTIPMFINKVSIEQPLFYGSCSKCNRNLEYAFAPCPEGRVGCLVDHSRISCPTCEGRKIFGAK